VEKAITMQPNGAEEIHDQIVPADVLSWIGREAKGYIQQPWPTGTAYHYTVVQNAQEYLLLGTQGQAVIVGHVRDVRKCPPTAFSVTSHSLLPALHVVFRD
jgi:hypothetical protein